MATHEQTWVKVNTKVDRRMARIVSALSSMNGLETLQSCEGTGTENDEAYIYFWYGSWQKVCDLVFGGLLPALHAYGVDATGSVEIFNGSLPTGKIGFSARVLEKATLALESFVASASS